MARRAGISDLAPSVSWSFYRLILFSSSNAFSSSEMFIRAQNLGVCGELDTLSFRLRHTRVCLFGFIFLSLSLLEGLAAEPW